MNNFQEAGEAVQHLAKQYKAVIELGAHLERLGSLENYEAEIEARIEKAKEIEVSAVAELAAAREAADEQVKQNAAVVDAAQFVADKIVLDANVDAAHVLALAGEQAAHIDEDAQARIKARDATIDEQQEVLAVLHDEIGRARTVLEDLNTQIEAVRAKFA